MAARRRRAAIVAISISCGVLVAAIVLQWNRMMISWSVVKASAVTTSDGEIEAFRHIKNWTDAYEVRFYDQMLDEVTLSDVESFDNIVLMRIRWVHSNVELCRFVIESDNIAVLLRH